MSFILKVRYKLEIMNNRGGHMKNKEEDMRFDYNKWNREWGIH